MKLDVLGLLVSNDFDQYATIVEAIYTRNQYDECIYAMKQYPQLARVFFYQAAVRTDGFWKGSLMHNVAKDLGVPIRWNDTGLQGRVVTEDL